MVGSAYTAADPDRAKPWFDQARHWFDKAQADAEGPQRPDGQASASPSSSSRPIRSPRPRGCSRRSSRGRADGKSPDLAAWARRQPRPGLRDAPARRGPPRPWPSSPARPGRTGAEPDDLRVLALIHEVQGTPRAAKLAIADLETLIAPRGRRARGPAPAGPAPGGRRRMAPGPRAIPRADPADRRPRATSRRSPAGPSTSSVRRGPDPPP